VTRAGLNFRTPSAVSVGVTTDLLDGGRPRRLILRKGRWYLEVARLVSTGDGVFRPHRQRIEGRAAILQALRQSKASPALADSAGRLVDSSADGDATFDAVEGMWVPSGLAPSYVQQLGRHDIRTPAEAALVAELTLLRASHEGLLARVARLERVVLGDPDVAKHAFAPKEVRRHAEVPFVATLRQGFPPEQTADRPHDEPDEGGGHEPDDVPGHEPDDAPVGEPAPSGLAFPPVTLVTSLLTQVCGQDVPLKEMKRATAEWVVSPERFHVAFLLDDEGGEAGAILFDGQAIARLGGALLALAQGEVDDQASTGAPNPDVVAAASEICTHLTGPINDMPGNLHVRARALSPLEEPVPGWLGDGFFVVCAHPGGGTVAFVAK
jgi:hypothetical protein